MEAMEPDFKFPAHHLFYSIAVIPLPTVSRPVKLAQ